MSTKELKFMHFFLKQNHGVFLIPLLLACILFYSEFWLILHDKIPV